MAFLVLLGNSRFFAGNPKKPSSNSWLFDGNSKNSSNCWFFAGNPKKTQEIIGVLLEKHLVIRFFFWLEIQEFPSKTNKATRKPRTQDFVVDWTST